MRGPGDVGLAREVDEALLRSASFSAVSSGFFRRSAELVPLRGVLDQERVGVDRRGVLGHRELDAVAVGDRPALGLQRQVLALLGERAVAQRARLDRVQPEGPRHDREQRE